MSYTRKEELALNNGRLHVAPFTYALHAVQYPDSYADDRYFYLDDEAIELPEWPIADPETSVEEKAGLVGYQFHYVGTAVNILYPDDRIRGVVDFCMRSGELVAEDFEELSQRQNGVFEFGLILPPSEVLFAMFKSYTRSVNARKRCTELEKYIGYAQA